MGSRSTVMCALAALGMGMAAVASGSATTVPATSAPGGATTATAPAASPLYTEILGDYMEGRWETLEAKLKAKTVDLRRLAPNEQENLAAIRLGLKEGRPDWWAVTKSGKKGQIMVLMWGQRIPVQFDPKTPYGYDTKMKNGHLALNAGWPNADMDSAAAAPGAPAGFTRGDVACMTAFCNLGKVDGAWQLPASGTELQKERYLEMRGALTAVAFATPPARRYAIWYSLASFTEANPKPPVRMGRRAAGAMFMIDVLEHPETYPSVELPKNIPPEKAEEALGLALADFVAKHPWDFAADTALKMAARQMATANGVRAFTSETISLPNKLTMALDPNKDAPLLAERNAWIVKTLANRATRK